MNFTKENLKNLIANIPVFAVAMIRRFIAIVKDRSGKPKTVQNLAFYWGVPCYIMLIIVARYLSSLPKFLDTIIASLVISYLLWHIFQVIRIKPKKVATVKKKAVSQEEKSAAFMRKLFLKESIFHFNPYNVMIAVDLIFIAHFYQICF